MLEVIGLKRSFHQREVVKDFSLRVGSGEVLAVLGQNGAGKTTCIRMMTGMLKPDQGEIYFRQKRVQGRGDWYKKRIGYVGQDTERSGYARTPADDESGPV